MARGLALMLAVLLAAGPARAGDFLVRTVGAATAVAVDRQSIRKTGRFRTGWTYEFYRERNPLTGTRPQITAILALVDCQTLSWRRLGLMRYLADGRSLTRFGPDKTWTEDLRNSNTDLTLRALCGKPDSDWARRRAGTVFELYRLVWR